MITEKKQRGRPRGSTINNPADHRLPHIRVTKEQLDKYRDAAASNNKTLSAWVKDTLDKVVDR